MVGGATNRNIDVKISEVNSKKVIYYRNFDWNNSIGVKFFNPNPPIEMNFGLNPSNNRIIAKISSQNAKKFDKVTYDEIIKKDLKVMDTSACALCKQNKIPINVFDFKAQGSLVKIMNGEDIGTYVSVN